MCCNLCILNSIYGKQPSFNLLKKICPQCQTNQSKHVSVKALVNVSIQMNLLICIPMSIINTLNNKFWNAILKASLLEAALLI